MTNIQSNWGNEEMLYSNLEKLDNLISVSPTNKNSLKKNLQLILNIIVIIDVIALNLFQYVLFICFLLTSNLNLFHLKIYRLSDLMQRNTVSIFKKLFDLFLYYFHSQSLTYNIQSSSF